MADTRSETRKRFDTEFAAARKRGDKTFDFDGKSIAVKLADETPSAKKMRDMGYDASGNQAPLRNIPTLSNKVEKEDLMAKGLLGNALMRAEVGDEKEELPATNYTPSKVSTKESLSPGEEAMKRGGKITHYKSAAAAVKAAEKRGDKSITVKFSHASKRADGIAQRGHTKGRMR